jgi:hypothetical protein
MKLRNLYLGIKDQLPWKRLLRNIWKGHRNIWKGHIFGLFSTRSHNNWNGVPKISYGSKESAVKAAQAMAKKRGVYFSNYKCIYCDGYHIGKNSDNKA